MATVHLIIGRISSGKTRYARELCKNGGVILSVDELEYDLFAHTLGEEYDAMMDRIKGYLHKKAVEIARSGCDVILDWGFWSRQERKAVAQYYREQGMETRWHYIDADADCWAQNIADRNCQVAAGATTDWYVDEGLLHKLNQLFEEPVADEVDVWHRNVR